MRRELFLVVAVAVLFVLTACMSSQTAEPQVASSGSMAAEAAAVDSGEMDEMGEEARDSESQSVFAEDKPEMEAADAEHPAGAQNQSPDSPEQNTEQSSEVGFAEQSEGNRPAWQQLALTNARTGESFTLADFEGKTVFVEPMATWCSNCRRQLNNVREASYQLAGDDVVLVALSVETNIDDATLADYANSQGFDWLFAVITPELLGELADEFGRAIANPPATPHFIIRADGTSTDLVTGIEPAAQILSQIAAAQG
ncbi:MAG: redoxin family protein [Candidatus Promineifilaceae bacterium]